MKLDIRKKIKDSFLYKRFAYRQSEGFIELMKFLEKENIIDDFCEECNFKWIPSKGISLKDYFSSGIHSFEFAESRKGFDFWYRKIFQNENFKKIENKIL